MPIKKRKGGGASRGYKSTTEMIKNYGTKRKTAKTKGVKKGRRPSYKVPKTPKASGYRWGR